MTDRHDIVRVAVKAPLAWFFDYLPPQPAQALQPGMRVRVPFARGTTTGIVVATDVVSTIAPNKLRRVLEVLDDEPVLDPELLGLLVWAAEYYCHAPGEVIAAALPRLLRAGRDVHATETVWSLSAQGRQVDIESLKRAPRQSTAVRLLGASQTGLGNAQLLEAMGEGWRRTLNTLQRKGWVQTDERPIASAAQPGAGDKPDFELTADQRDAIQTIGADLDRFGSYLLHGITGSGKTEVYLQLIETITQQKKQALVLVPEIGLTPQLVERFQRRLTSALVVMHSGLGDAQRLAAWRAANDGTVGVIVGTRSAVFAPLRTPGIIIVDEEHDGSYKQQEGFRYSARDLAVMRARRHDIPVVLGSATPSLESLHNANTGRYTRLGLDARPGAARLPDLHLVDMSREIIDAGLSATLISGMRKHLDDGAQVLLFLNRRGFAPAWYCAGCGWLAPCSRCDARMTLHQAINLLRCHHCGAQRRPETNCPDCDTELQPIGQGTERIEETIERLFPDAPIARIDRDSTRRHGSLEQLLGAIRSGERRILIGTQMLTKGHHFPDVTLVGILDADQGLFGTDPRSNERLAQMIVQVAGRAGRAQRPGEVLIQTRCPEHPLLKKLVTEGYSSFAEAALAEREAARWPPFTSLALLRAEARTEAGALQFLTAARELAGKPAIRILGPAPAPMARRAGRYRAQLLLEGERAPLHRFLAQWRPRLEDLPDARRTRWSLDVDPGDLF